MTFPDGDSYVGDWDNGHMNGWGAFYWNNGNSFQVSCWVKLVGIALNYRNISSECGRRDSKSDDRFEIERFDLYKDADIFSLEK